MTEQNTTKKKRMGALGWIVIGCLGILILAGVLTFACTVIFAKKAKDFVEEVSENPVTTAAELFVRFNPDYELVGTDEESGTVTLREKSTGEMFTIDYEDLKEGKLSFKKGDQEVTFDPTSADGVIQVTGGEDGESMTIGQGDLSNLPAWVPLYPGTDAQLPMQMTSPEGISGTVSMKTDDSIADVLAFYESALEDAGFEIQKGSFSGDGATTSTVTGTKETVTVNVVVTSEGGPTGVAVNYSGPN